MKGGRKKRAGTFSYLIKWYCMEKKKKIEKKKKKRAREGLLLRKWGWIAGGKGGVRGADCICSRHRSGIRYIRFQTQQVERGVGWGQHELKFFFAYWTDGQTLRASLRTSF